MILEIACFTYSDAMIVLEGGASRIELCSSRVAGGMTPSIKTALEFLRVSTVPVFIMVRPRSAIFSYNEKQIAEMKKTIRFFKKQKCAGFVFGALTSDKRIDKKLNSKLVKLARPLPCTFHRAFDLTPDLGQALEDVIACGFKRVLTSGGKGKAHENLETLKLLFKQAGRRITLLPGGGVRAANVKKIRAATKCKEIHSGATNPKSRRISLTEVRNIRRKLV